MTVCERDNVLGGHVVGVVGDNVCVRVCGGGRGAEWLISKQ